MFNTNLTKHFNFLLGLNILLAIKTEKLLLLLLIIIIIIIHENILMNIIKLLNKIKIK